MGREQAGNEEVCEAGRVFGEDFPVALSALEALIEGSSAWDVTVLRCHILPQALAVPVRASQVHELIRAPCSKVATKEDVPN